MILIEHVPNFVDYLIFSLIYGTIASRKRKNITSIYQLINYIVCELVKNVTKISWDL